MRWGVELLGESFDLDLARTLFASGTIRVEKIEGITATVLVADDFESLTECVQVRAGAKSLTDFILRAFGSPYLWQPFFHAMVLRSSRGRPLDAPTAFIHPCQPMLWQN
jgi:hypothetical protein